MSHTLSSKQKRYQLSVQKVLDSFESLEEWADYISFLLRLQKSLKLDDKDTEIPLPSLVSLKLAYCLSSQLPSGVHQKALILYELILNSLSQRTFDNQLSFWLPGIFPLFSYASLSVKPLLIKIYNIIIEKTTNLQLISKPYILSLLLGLEDENSEVFNDVMILLDSFKLKLNQDSIFWQSLWISIIDNKEVRLGALRWLVKELPVIATNTEVTETMNDTLLEESSNNIQIEADINVSRNENLSDAINACLFPEPGLMLRAFAVSISASNDIVAVRGYFDLLLSHLPISSYIFKKIISRKDKELLIMACVKITLLKDMSLNRRVWNYLLGPEDERSNRSEYFKSNALNELKSGLLKMIDEERKSKIDVYRISVALIMDKWEISSHVTGFLCRPLLVHCCNYKSDLDLVTAAQSFFDGIEPTYLWQEINVYLASDDQLDLVNFALKTFNFNDEETVSLHASLGILLTLGHSMSFERVDILNLLIEMLPFSHSDVQAEELVIPVEQVHSMIIEFYKSKILDSNALPPFSKHQLISLILDHAKSLYIFHFQDDFSILTSQIFCRLLELFPAVSWSRGDFINAVLSLNSSELNISSALAAVKVLGHIEVTNFKEKRLLLKKILSCLWFSLSSTNPSNYQVETVKAIYDLLSIFLSSEIEAGVFELLSKSSILKRIKAFTTLWTHSTLINDGDLILVRPLQLLLDELEGPNSGLVSSFVSNNIKSGSANRLIKLITDPLLTFDFFSLNCTEVSFSDDYGQFSYYVKTIFNVINSNPKLLREAFNNELALIDSASKIGVLESNGWDVSSYKSLLLLMMNKFFKLSILNDQLYDDELSIQWHDSICVAIDIVQELVTGNEPDFFHRLDELLAVCTIFIGYSFNSEILELVERKVLTAILRFLEMAEGSSIKLNLLTSADESKDPELVQFLVKGIIKAETSTLLETWLSLLTKSVYLFGNSIFDVLLTLNDALVQKLDLLFHQISDCKPISDLTDAETSMNYLLSGLEDLLCISHGYLVSSSIQSVNKSNAGNDGFFGTVIQGVFQIESPAVRSSEQNKLYSLLISFQDSVKLCFNIWKWADAKPQVSLKGFSDRSLTFVASKLRFRSKKLLETLMELERKEVIESFVELDPPKVVSIKLLNILDGGRSQVTLPHIFDSIISRCYPQSLEESKRAPFASNLTEKEISKFLVAYFNSIDSDTVLEIFSITTQFLKSVISNIHHYRVILPDCLRVAKLLFLKLDSSKFAEQKRSKRELADILVKLLSSMISKTSSPVLSETVSEDSSVESNVWNSSQNEVANAVEYIIGDLDLILADADRLNSTINVIITNFIVPQTKGRKAGTISGQTIGLLQMIGDEHPTKLWKQLVHDLFHSNSFFEQDPSKLDAWNGVISTWIAGDAGKVEDMVSKITLAPASSTPNLFIWKEGSEIDLKINTIKKLSYVLLVQPDDSFVFILDDLFERIKNSVSGTCPAKYRAEVSTLLRVITLKFSEPHLISRWTFINYELMCIFEKLLSGSAKELATLPPDEITLVLYGCKLLDQSLLLGFEEFNLFEWTYVTKGPDLIDGSLKGQIVSIIDRISLSNDLSFTKEAPLNLGHPPESMKPVLYGVKSVKNIAKLRLFFNSLSLINYERMFGLHEVDKSHLLSDAINDILF